MEIRKLTRNDIRRMVEEAIEKVLSPDPVKWYRGYNTQFGETRDHLLWLTSDIDYARDYGDAVMEYTLDWNQLNGCVSDIPEDIDILDGPSKEDCEELLADGINSYIFYAGGVDGDDCECLCMWSREPIISKRRIL